MNYSEQQIKKALQQFINDPDTSRKFAEAMRKGLEVAEMESEPHPFEAQLVMEQKPDFDNLELFNRIKALSPLLEDSTWSNDEVPTLTVYGDQFGFGQGQPLMTIYVPYAPNSELNECNEYVSYSIFDAEQIGVEEDYTDQCNLAKVEEMIKKALKSVAAYNRSFIVTPKINIDVLTPQSFQMNQVNNEHYARLAIEQVREMDAEKLKARVLRGLQDADAYPCDFAEY